MATGSTTDMIDRFHKIVAAEQALREVKTAFAADLAPDVVRVVVTDEGATAYYRRDDRLKEAKVELVDIRTPTAPAAGVATLP